MVLKMKYRSINFRIIIIAILAFTALGLSSARARSVDPYPSLDEVVREIQSLAREHPDKVSLEVIGTSVQGRPIYALHIARKDGIDRPQALVTANIHAGEVISSRVALGAATRLVRADGKEAWISSLLDSTEIWIVPVLNPDGYHRVISTNGKGGKIGTRKNAGGVDLNRNFPLSVDAKSRHPLAGNRRPKSTYYMGPKPLSEPESRAIADLQAQHGFYAAINLHSVAGKFIYPYCHTKQPAPHEQQLKAMGQAFTARQPHQAYPVSRSYAWYPTLGDLDDFLYIDHGVMSATVEVGTVGHNLKYAILHPAVFWIMNPHDVDYWVENDRDAVLGAIQEALALTSGKAFEPETTKPAVQ